MFSYQSHSSIIVFSILNELYVCLSSECSKQQQRHSAFWLILSPTFFSFQVPWTDGLLAPAQSDSTLWILLVLARPPQSPTGAWSQPREGQVGTVFSLYGTVLPIGEKKKVPFIPLKGIKHWWLFLKKGFSKLSHIGKNQHVPTPMKAGYTYQISLSVQCSSHIVALPKWMHWSMFLV